MRILHVNKFLYRRGGAESYMLDLAAIQQAAGHAVEFFAMKHPQNLPSRYEQHFPGNVELEPMPASLLGKAQGAGRLLFSPSALLGMSRVVRDFKPDVVHLHNIYHQLSPSILRPLISVPTVMTLHDYKLACPTYRFLDKGEICEACLGGNFRKALVRRCNRGSVAASGLNALEMRLHMTFGAYEPVQLFLCPSRFLAGKMREAGVFPDRMRHLPHFIETAGVDHKLQPGGGAVYAGRLSHEKGVDVLIEAASMAGVHVDVAGEGPEMDSLKRLAVKLADGLVTFHGRISLAEVRELLRAGAVAALPARWYENQPLSVLDAYACGVPVVGSNLGGIPELIEDRVDGYLIPPDDPAELGSRLRSITDSAGGAYEMGLMGRRKVEDQFSVERHLAGIDGAYADAAAGRRQVETSSLGGSKPPAQG
ncbi:glycosyltransferase family 4 protein [soil metagenome]